LLSASLYYSIVRSFLPKQSNCLLMRTKSKSKRSLSFLFMFMVILLYTIAGDSLCGEQVSMAGGFTDISSINDSMMTNVLGVLWDIVCYSF